MIACEYCDAIHQRVALTPGACANCRRCGSLLYRESTGAYQRLLPLLLSALILFMLSNAFAIVSIDLKGVHLRARLMDAVLALQADHMVPLAILVFATTILFPLLEMLLLLHLLVALRSGRRPPRFAFVVRCVATTRVWGMTEVFMIGVLVTVVKLSAMAQVIPGIALWSFGALVLVLAAVMSFDPRDLWQFLADDLPTQRERSRP